MSIVVSSREVNAGEGSKSEKLNPKFRWCGGFREKDKEDEVVRWWWWCIGHGMVLHWLWCGVVLRNGLPGKNKNEVPKSDPCFHL